MLVAMVHYHLRPGGVTRVIELAMSAVAKEARCVVLSGERPFTGFGPAGGVRVVPGLGYDGSRSVSPETLAENMAEEARKALGAAPDLWHVHNHSLGKNCALPAALEIISRKGRMVLQIHDFAEDGRPSLFRTLLQKVGRGDVRELGRRVYPQAGHIHYATLNRRDRDLLSEAGVPAERLHVLPNPVVLSFPGEGGPATGPAEENRPFIYATRAIRRKNIGEFLFWAAVADAGKRFAVTLAPENPRERPGYDKWTYFAEKLSLPVEFELGKRLDIPVAGLLQHACAAVTTSVAEGFGLAFLEPWLARRPVLGRKLPEITGEFEAAGVDLSLLYERLMLPASRQCRAELMRKIRFRLGAVCYRYGRNARPGDAERALAACTRDGRVDFGRLDEELQRKMIEKAANSASFRSELTPRHLAPVTGTEHMLEHNVTLIERSFGLEPYGRKLAQIYRGVAGSKIEPHEESFDVNTLLDKFLAPERFFLLKT